MSNQNNPPPPVVLDTLVVTATRITPGGFSGFTGYQTKFTLAWNTNTGTFDAKSDVYATFAADDPHPATPPPPAVPPVDPLHVVTVASDGPPWTAVQRILQTFIYTFSDGSTQTFNLFLAAVNGKAVYFYANGTNWVSAPFPGGPWTPAIAPPKNAQDYNPI